MAARIAERVARYFDEWDVCGIGDLLNHGQAGHRYAGRGYGYVGAPADLLILLIAHTRAAWELELLRQGSDPALQRALGEQYRAIVVVAASVPLLRLSRAGSLGHPAQVLVDAPDAQPQCGQDEEPATARGLQRTSETSSPGPQRRPCDTLLARLDLIAAAQTAEAAEAARIACDG
jgi:hypothetical protein